MFPEINPGETTRIYIEIGFTIVKCENVPLGAKSFSCKETLMLYGTSLRENEELSQNWFNYSQW